MKDKTLMTSESITVVCGIILSVLGILSTPWILHAMGTPEEVFHEAEVFLIYIKKVNWLQEPRIEQEGA